MSIETRIATTGSLSMHEELHDLAARLQGELLRPGDPDFDSARAVTYGHVDRQPVLIARCADAVDVRTVVMFARAHGLSVAVRSGGHSPAGYGTCDGGVLIDLSAMKAIEIDPVRRLARVEPGLTWGEVAAATQPYGLAITSGDMATVGVGGLTLGGGIGWMVRKYGLTIDLLRAVELVTADGRHLRASAEEHAELFWGLRGGGGNFGVATAFEFDLKPAGIVLGGAILYDAADAESVLRAYADYAASAPYELSTQALLLVMPPLPFLPPHVHGKPAVVILTCYTGDLATGEIVSAPLRRFGTPLFEMVGPMPYPAMFGLTDIGELPGMQQHMRTMFLEKLGDEALHTLVAETASLMAPGLHVQIRVLGGAMSRIPVHATAFAYRDKLIIVSAGNAGPEFLESAVVQAPTEQIQRALQPYAAGAYVNLLGDERVRDAYPPATYARLAALKQRYDPHNMFRHNQNIVPAR